MGAGPETRTRRGPDILPGKRVGGVRYLHALALSAMPVNARDRIAAAERIAGLDWHDWNVVKLADREKKVSLLHYAAFLEDPFPPLVTAWAVDLDLGAVRKLTYEVNENPPILHRKELLLPANHPQRARFEQLTAELEKYGVYRDPGNIGRRRAWEARLAEAGVWVDDHEVKVRSER